jgi:CO dehydrogenase/acetyl-CoA synthase gamma subunit (corrinoid Fe-S protein)
MEKKFCSNKEELENALSPVLKDIKIGESTSQSILIKTKS